MKSEESEHKSDSVWSFPKSLGLSPQWKKGVNELLEEVCEILNFHEKQTFSPEWGVPLHKESSGYEKSIEKDWLEEILRLLIERIWT